MRVRTRLSHTYSLSLSLFLSLSLTYAQLAPAGQAVLAGVRLGDAVVSLDHEALTLYDHVMARLPHLPRPLVVGFRRKMEGIGSSPPPSASPTHGGGGGATLTPAKAFAGGFGNSLHALKAASVGLAAAAATAGAGPMGGGSGLTTKVALREALGTNEFDTTFEDGPLGMRLEEKAVALNAAGGGGGGLKYVSVVVQVTDGGAAHRQGVGDGCLVLGVNGERFISHAHTVATLKHGRRPVQVRFRRPASSSS